MTTDEAPFGSFTIHALNRCHLRWGFVPTVEQTDLAVLDIIERRSVPVSYLRGGLEFHHVLIRDDFWPVVYSPRDAMVVTAFAPGWEPIGIQYSQPTDLFVDWEELDRTRPERERVWNDIVEDRGD